MNRLSSFTFHTDGNVSLLLLHNTPSPSLIVLMGSWIAPSTLAFLGCPDEVILIAL